MVVIADGVLIAHLTRGGRVLTLFGEDRETNASLVVAAVRRAVAESRMQRVRIEEIDGERVGASGLEQTLLAAGARITPKGVSIEGAHA